MQQLKKITSRETFPVRHPVLRPGLPEDSCIFAGDDLETTVHFGLYDNEDIAGVISVFRAANPAFTDELQFQIRGMAVLPQHQKKGFGEQLVQHAEEYVKQAGGNLIWFNAREAATGFYKKTGYHITGSPFDIPGVGTHYVMYKRL